MECSNKKRKRLIKRSVGKKVSPRFKRKAAPNSFWPKEAKKNIRENNTAQSLGTGAFLQPPSLV